MILTCFDDCAAKLVFLSLKCVTNFKLFIFAIAPNNKQKDELVDQKACVKKECVCKTFKLVVLKWK